jgi:hypothetical protein
MSLHYLPRRHPKAMHPADQLVKLAVHVAA